MSVLLYVLLLFLFGRALHRGDAATLLVPKIAEHAGHCIESERMALLDFKKSISDPQDELSSWAMGQDCCSWEGVRCDNLTGNVIGLELGEHDLQLKGDISPSLLQLQRLNYLNLSHNYFDGATIPSFNGQFKELRYLDLSYSYFNGTIPASFGNLSSLQTLDLSDNDGVYVDDPAHQWLSHLTSLQHLYMSGVTFGGISSSSSLFLALNKLPAIKEIDLSQCQLKSIPPSIPHLNFSSLSVLDLSNNNINFSVSPWVFDLKSLEYLDLSYNFYGSYNSYNWSSNFSTGIAKSIGSLCNLKTLDLTHCDLGLRLAEFNFTGCLKDSLTHLQLSFSNLDGEIPDWIGDIKNLRVLDLYHNSLSGSVPSSMGRLSLLEELNLFSNNLNGTLPVEIGKLAELVILDLSENQMRGIITEAHFSNLEKLNTLDMAFNSFVFNVSSNWIPPFLLQELRIYCCSVGPEFPTWLKTQHNLNVLDISNAGISSSVPDWFWNLISVNLTSLSMSENQIEGMLPKLSTSIQWNTIDLSSNRFYGPLPGFLGSSISYINLSNNSFSGSISHMIEENIHSYLRLLLSMNKLNGTLPKSLCQIEFEYLDISKNNLSGELPDCWSTSSGLSDLNLSNNKLTGGIPDSISYLSRLSELRLSHNNLSGEIPASLKNCSQLDVLDLSYNNFTGSIPIWVGESLSRLVVLILRSNTFIGHIPHQISKLEYIQILDLSNNNLSGPIPVSFGNFSAMQTLSKSVFSLDGILGVGDTIVVASKGKEEEYSDHLIPYVKIMDLSNNALTGDIPEELASLYGLQSLHLASNHLEGEIPDKLGQLQQLESLDLSRNKLSGSIPSTFSSLTSLSDFNVSYNDLSGRIPSGNQFDTLTDPSIYIGNHLCGFPLTDNCTKGGGPIQEKPSDHGNEEDDDEMVWMYIGSLSGFAVGFWTIWGVLIFKKKWRYAHFRYTDTACDNIYVWVAVKFARMKSKIMSKSKH